MKTDNRARRRALLTSAAAPAIALALMATAAQAQEAAKTFAIAPQPLADALLQLSKQADIDIVASTDLTRGRVAPKVAGEMTTADAMSALLAGSGLVAAPSGAGYVITRASDPQSGSAAGDGADAGTVQALIVTAQKREENIQDVPIAMSAFTQEDLTTRQVAGGPDLITQIPNFTFTKTNFSGYSIQIRGIGTQAISATTDPAVAVAFNNTPFIRNRFFEQEFYDLERVEVLRGPQGTLYGRNATAGVVNIISAKPKFTYEAKLSGDVSNYNSTRLEGMVNIPLVEDKVALRLAGAWTKRDGYATNQLTGNQIDGRDLWSTRATLRFEPTAWISANLIWEHFQENDDRLRSGKQLCEKHRPTMIGDLEIPLDSGGGFFNPNSYFNQGCTATSLYSPEAFQTPNGFSLPFYGPTGNLGNPVDINLDPYLSSSQSPNLRVIESSIEPRYHANTDIAELQVSLDMGNNITFSSETAYNSDSLSSLEDYNRFTTVPHAFKVDNILGTGPNGIVNSDGTFCDPQLGCSDRLLLADLSTSNSTQFSQEFRLATDFDGPFNFSVGVNYLRHDALDKYYVFVNSLTMLSVSLARGGVADSTNPWQPGVSDNHELFPTSPGSVGDTALLPDSLANYVFSSGSYIDPNPIGNLNDQGRNYFLSTNPYKLISYAVFGESYYNLTGNLKVTAGLRWTVDKKQAPQIFSWLLAGLVNNRGAGPYPTVQTVDQEWREPTGRLAIDWKPNLRFTDETLLYASYAHGYKAGGANPPRPVLVTYGQEAQNEFFPDTFSPEFVNAFEVGSKNTLAGGALTLNLTGFYYDYTGYQISEIRNRAAVNSNYDAEIWGLEVEADWRPLENLRLGFKGGYENTRVADGMKAIDLMDRTAGHVDPITGEPDWIVLRDFPTVPSNCILPVYVVTAGGVLNYSAFGSSNRICTDAYLRHLDPGTGLPYVPNPTLQWAGPNGETAPLDPLRAGYPGFNPDDPRWNGGRGFYKDLSGNELPNAPHFTATLTADYTLPLPNDWLMNLHGDLHYQGESWARIFNMPGYDKLKAYTTANLAAIFTNDDAGWKVMAYVKNVFDETAITGAFLNSDDTGLTTNVFLTEPRLYGLRVTKEWNGEGLAWLGIGGHHTPGAPYALTVEIGGGTDQFGGDAENYTPPWLGDSLNVVGGTLAAQTQDLDWGDTRDVKLTYAPSGGWKVAGAYRFGKTNASHRVAAYGGNPPSHLFAADGPTLDYDNHGISAVKDTEAHSILDFEVGRDLGLGAIHSAVSAGLRYANFKSTSHVTIDGIADSYIVPIVPLKYFPGAPRSHFNAFTNTLDSEREFEGAGPSISWDAALRLWGDDTAGHADVDWSVSGGVLFGKQTTDNNETIWGQYDRGTASNQTRTTLYDETLSTVHRSHNVSVPNVSLTLGLSYSVERVKVSTGYSYDRFFNAIDGGVSEAKSYDRTIQGPYLKLAIGFGG